MRPNLSISGSPIPPPPDFTPPTKPLKKPESSQPQAPITVAGQTKPIDAALTERVVRQQYAVNEAAVDNSRKRKALPSHLMSLVKNGVEEHERVLDEKCESSKRNHDDWLDSSNQIDPRNRWKVVNGKKQLFFFSFFFKPAVFFFWNFGLGFVILVDGSFGFPFGLVWLDQLTNVEQAQEDYTATGLILSKLLTVSLFFISLSCVFLT
jgi:hypothetical protein